MTFFRHSPTLPPSLKQPTLAKDPATGLCHNFAESNYANNVGQAVINIPDHPGREGVGPLKNETALDYEPQEH